ncbi:MAG: DUF72 domain-containing protein, partial [Actinomycetota bacterium]
MSGRGTLYVGTSGFAYKEWKGSFYPQDLPERQMLAYYSGRLPSVEINYTFRRLPTESALEGWRRQAGAGFRITLKAFQRITHTKRLKDCREEVDLFVRRARHLDDRLGVILFQLPPTLAYDRGRLEEFLAGLAPRGRPICPYAMEFRHPSWSDPEVETLLGAHGVARCAAETETSGVPSIPGTSSHVYLRLRKDDYSREELSRWGSRLENVLAAGRDVYCYFKHEGA